MRNPRFYIERDVLLGDTIRIRFGYDDDRGNLYVTKPVEMVMVPENEVAPEASMLALYVSRKGINCGGVNAIQSLMDQLWAIGVRPSDIGTPGHLAATQKHLNDMRAIVEKGIELKLP